MSWSNVASPTKNDWIGLYHPGDANTAYSNWVYDNSCTKTAGAGTLSSGSCSFVMPTTAGTYQFRLLANDGLTVLATSGNVTVTSPGLTATPSSVSKISVTVSWSNVVGPTKTDWIGLYHPADANTAYTDWIYDNSCTKTRAPSTSSSGSCSFVMPTTAGTYQFGSWRMTGSPSSPPPARSPSAEGDRARHEVRQKRGTCSGNRVR